MPLYKDFSDQDAQIFVWKYDESEDYPAELLEPENISRFQNHQPKKLLEAHMVRKILNEKLPAHKILYQDSEPYLEPRDYEISISHSFPYAALAFSKNKIGIDLESFKEKISRVKDKFIQKEEQNFIPKNQEVEYLTVIWSVKESLYKLHHSKHWSLKKHYEVRPFLLENSDKISCRVHDENGSDECISRAEFFENFVLTAARECCKTVEEPSAAL